MIRFFLIVIAVGIVVLGAAVVILAEYHGTPASHEVVKDVPITKFPAH
jgi:hypothetical protein